MENKNGSTAAAILTQVTLESFRAVAPDEFKSAAIPANTKALQGVENLVKKTYNEMLHAVGALVTNPASKRF